MFDRVWQTVWVEGFSVDSRQISPRVPSFGWDGVKTHRSSVLELLSCSGCCFLDPVPVFVLLLRFIFTVCFTMVSLRDLYKECQAVVSTLSLQFGNVKFNKSLCRLLTNKYVACLTYLDNYIFREDGSIDLPCETALVELRRIMLCGQLLVKQWTQEDWWMSVITSSYSASLDKTVILHLREFLACVNVLLPMETNMAYGPALDSLDSSVQQACRRDIEGLIISMKQYRRGIISTSESAKLAKHLSEKLETEFSDHQHPYVIDIPLDVEISKDRLGDGSYGAVYKCTFLGVMAAAKVWKTSCINTEPAEKEASLFSKLQHPNVVQFIGYGVEGSQPVIVSELMSTDLRRYLDEKKKNAGEGPPLPLLVAMNILLQIAEAMTYLHENGVMHRDLKAKNVLINVVEGPDGQLSSSSVQVKLTDFGEAKLKLHDSGYTTLMKGTTAWRAPEVFELEENREEENREKYTQSADVYSFSMVCFEVLTGDIPFRDKPRSTLLQNILNGVRPQLPDVDYCPEYLSALIKKCWATNAVERPQFPEICQRLVDYKARVLKHPYWVEDLPPDSSQRSQTMDIADTADTKYVIEDDNNHRAHKSATSCAFTEGLTSRNLSVLQQVQSLSVDRPYCVFSFKELEAATASFSPGNWVRTVDWGDLYRAELQDGRPVAIMWLHQKEPTKEKLFLTEIEINTCLSHANIVSLIGYCVGKAHLILVYDFLPEGTLDEHLHGEEVLKWEDRYKIAVGICKALVYLHDGSPRPVIHMNVKPSNFFLSHDFQPQLSSFGLAKWAPKQPMYICCNDMVGTPGYADPEYYMCQRVNDKTDVYSFGVVLLELITGHKPIDTTRPQGETNLITWVQARPLLDERNLDKLVDLRLGSTYNDCQMQAMIAAAALCLQQSSQCRPQISQVLKMLGKDSNGKEGLSTGGTSRPVYIADTTYVNHGAWNSATSCMSEINSHKIRLWLQLIRKMNENIMSLGWSLHASTEGLTSKNLAVLQQVQSIYFQRPSRRRFSIMELEAATGGFSAGNLVGKGDFNKVYRGELQDGRLVGIKCPRNSESQENFRGLEINSCLSHANIVSLIGYCVENTQLILVYDSLHQQTLSDYLHGEDNVLGWEVRYKVAVGICKALEYLHDGSPGYVIHRNVKPSKILVSHNFQPKLSGLEFATWAPKRSIYQADKVVGTIGYLDPECAITGKFSDKSDVYSFGVVLVELITGRKVKDGTRPQGEQYLMAWARPLLDKRNLDELVDPQLGKTYNVSQMQAMILAAALCVQQSSQRPKISEVLKMLDEVSNTDED